jgi:hypothetical protein
MNPRWLVLLFLFALCYPVAVSAQSRINPDLSVIGDMRYAYRDDLAAALAGQDNLAFQFEELEINFAGYLNPYARADAYVAVHGVTGPVEIEEAYATLLRGLPAQLRFGKYFLDFGRINQMHRHQLPWLEYPLMLASFFGDEGARVIGLQASRLQGVGDTAVRLSLNAFRSDFFGHDHDEEAEEEHGHEPGGEDQTKIGGSGRLSLFREVGETSGLEIGGSYLYATYDIEENLKTQVGSVDFTYKWVPDNYKGFRLMAEAMVDDREVLADTLGTVTTARAYGAFANAELRFRRMWDVGTFYDWSQNGFDPDIEVTSYGGYIGLMPVEETLRFSVVYRYADSNVATGESNSVILQVIWSLGPHKPHPF